MRLHPTTLSLIVSLTFFTGKISTGLLGPIWALAMHEEIPSMLAYEPTF
jgi:hypothetical protein